MESRWGGLLLRGAPVFVGETQYYCACETWDQVSAYNTATGYRGNLTNITTYTDGAAATGAISYDYTYDVAGNERTSTTNCCQQIGSSYSTATQYLYPDSITKGSSNPMSSERITQSYTYDTNTKVPTEIVDFNGNDTDVSYDAVSRATLVTLNSGATKTITYNNSSLNQNEHVQKSSGEGSGTVSNSTTYFNGRGQVKESRYQAGASNWNATQIKYNLMGRQWKVSRPYDTGSSPSYWSETTYDYLGRVTQQLAPDTTSSVTITYSPSATPSPTPATGNTGQTATTSDAWGRQRWTRYDAFGRLVEAIEPNPTGSTGSVSAGGAISTVYAYDRLDRLTSITQGDQTRSFAYDAIGRLTHQKLPEQAASLDSTGDYVGSGTWSDVFEYDSRSNLIQRTDARGVKTIYNYQVSSSPDPLNRLQSISYNTSDTDSTYTIHAAPTVSFDYMTTGDKTRVNEIIASGVSTETNTFDGEGRVSSYELTLDSQPSKPFKIDYVYDTAHRLTQINYPKKYQMSSETQPAYVPSYDQASRLTQLTFEGSSYLSDVSYNTSSQVTSLKTGAATSYPRVESYSYDAALGLLTGQTVKDASLTTTYLDMTYSYNRESSAGSTTGRTGQLTKIVNNANRNRDRLYQFDALGRLKYAKGGLAAGATGIDADWTQEYTYDRYGNKTATPATGDDENLNAVPADGLTSTATTTSTNRITAFTYDRTGNIVRGQNASGVWQVYEYDAAGRLKEVEDDYDTDLEVYTYGTGRQKLLTDDGNFTYYHVWGGSSIIAEYVLASSTPRWIRSYIYAGSRLLLTTARNTSSTEVRETHHPDRLGTKLVTNVGAGTDFQQSTLPFGSPLAGESSGYSNRPFTSYDRSAITGLDYANNRTYSSGQGRFTQVDPIGMAAASIGDPQSNNLYSYVQNMPTDLVDPSGLNASSGSYVCWDIVTTGHYTNDPETTVRVSTRTVCISGLGGMSNPGVGYNGGGGGASQGGGPCARMATRAQQIWNQELKRQINDRQNPPNASFSRLALPSFDQLFASLYVGRNVDGTVRGSVAVYANRGGNNTSSPAEKGQQDFKDQYLDSDYPRNSTDPNADQVHHFAGYFSAGLNSAALVSSVHRLTDTDDLVFGRGSRGPNRGDLRLGDAAYSLGQRIAKNPGLMSNIGDLIRNAFCL